MTIRRRGARTILIVGNGSIGIDETGKAYVNRTIGQLLLEIRNLGMRPIYASVSSEHDPNGNLQGFCMNAHNLEFYALNRKRRFESLLRLLKMISRLDSVYLFFPSSMSVCIAPLCVALGKPYAVYVRGCMWRPNWLNRFVFRSARFVLTVSPLFTQQLQKIQTNTETVRPMVDIEISDIVRRPDLNVQPKCWRLLFVGRLETEKGVEELFEMARILSRSGFEFELRLVGGGPLYNRALQLQKEGEGSGRRIIQVCGFIADKGILMKEYEEAHMLIMPSHHEGFPRVIYEAMAKGLPVITTFVGGIAGIMRSEQNCIEVPVGKPDVLASSVKRLADDLALLNRLGKCGQNSLERILENRKSHAAMVVAYLDAKSE